MTGLPISTLCILVRGHPADQVLLGYKKAGFGPGKYTGFGGKLEHGESPAEAAQREMWEESGVWVELDDLRYAGRLKFIFPARPEWSQQVMVYLAWRGEGDPVESDEMIPAWFNPNELPYDKMWQDARHWLPPVLAGRCIEAEFIFQDDLETIQHLEIRDL